MKKKTKMITTEMILDNKRNARRARDEVELIEQVIGGVFDWAHRYDAKYTIQYARDNEWQPSRLMVALNSIDVDYRNHMRIKDE